MAVIAAILSAVEFFARCQGGLPKEKRCASQRISSQEEGFNMITTLTALAAAGYIGLLFFLGADGLQRGYGFRPLFGRFMLFLYSYRNGVT